LVDNKSAICVDPDTKDGHSNYWEILVALPI